MTRGRRPDTYNSATMIWAGVIYACILIVFGYQTWQFLAILFPNQNILLQIFGIVSFDVSAFAWAVTYHKRSFYSRQAKLLVAFAWAVTFFISTIASVLYMSMTNVIDFHITLPTSMLQIGDWTVIGATVFNLLCLTFFFKLETEAANPHKDMFDVYETVNGLGDEQVMTPDTQMSTGAYQQVAPAQRQLPPAHMPPATLQQNGQINAPAKQRPSVQTTVQQVAPMQFTGTPDEVKRLKREAITRLYRDGYSKAYIARTVGVARQTVDNWLRK